VEFDFKYIRLAIFLARKIVGTTFPNPAVFSLVVESNKELKDHKIINFGYTAITGRPHAESYALKGLNFKSKKIYTLYSTLEPCCHEGRSESCVDKILRSKIDRVVFSILDPDPRVNGKGMKILKKNGIKVISGLLKNEAFKLYEGYFFNRILKRPKVILKLASSLDGKISFRKGQKSKITNNMSGTFLHILRSEVDAILVGSNTVRVDDCILSSRIENLINFSPIRIVLNKNLDLNLNLRVFKNCKKTRTIIFSQEVSQKKINLYKKKNVEIISLKKDKYHLKYILQKIAKLGISDLLIEGGAKIFSSFIKNNFYDQVLIFRSNFFVGPSGKELLDNKEPFNFPKKKFVLKKMTTFKNDQLEVFNNSNQNDSFLEY